MREQSPGGYDHADDGCEVAPACLRCPMPVCKYDDPGYVDRVDHAARNELIITLREQGLDAEAIAQRAGVSARTVHRVLQGGRAAIQRPEPDIAGTKSLKELQEARWARPRRPWPVIAVSAGRYSPGNGRSAAGA